MGELFPDKLTVKVTDMHAGGHPLRIIESGIPHVQGETNAEKRAWLQTCGDHYRQLVMSEPRGHKGMFGALLVTPDVSANADLGVIFLNSSGYSPMCGHGIICLGRYAVDRGLVAAVSPETRVVVQCPCGPVTVYVTCHDNVTSDVRFMNVPSYVFAPDVEISVAGVGRPVTVDIVWGGAFYAFLSASQLGLDFSTLSASDLTAFYVPIKEAVGRAVKLQQADHPDLAFLYGVIFTDGKERQPTNGGGGAHVHTCVFADKQVDRSPCGSGTSARVALEHYRGVLPLGHKRHFQSGMTGSEFKGTVMRQVEVKGAGVDGNDVVGVVAEVSGRSYYTGETTFTVEANDPLAGGFLIV